MCRRNNEYPIPASHLYFRMSEIAGRWCSREGSPEVRIYRKYPLIPTLWMIFEDSTFAFRSGDKHRSRRIYGK